jgi:hypothetical protein
MRTIAASIAYRLSLSTSSITFFLSSTGGRGIYKTQNASFESSTLYTKVKCTVYRSQTLILLSLSVNLELNSKLSFGEIVFVAGSLIRILYLAHDSEWSNLTKSSWVRFSWVNISE